MLAAGSCLVEYASDDVVCVSVLGSAVGYAGYGEECSDGTYAGAEVVAWAEPGEPGALCADG